MKRFLALCSVLALAGCEEKGGGIPPEFNLVYSEGGYHFVHLTGEAVGSTVKQREGGQAICGKFNSGEDCQVFLWKRREEVPESFPIRGAAAQAMGYFQVVDGRIKQKTLK